VPELDAFGFRWLGTWVITKTYHQDNNTRNTRRERVVSCHVMSQKCDEFEFSRILNSCCFLSRAELVVRSSSDSNTECDSNNGEHEVLCRVTEVRVRVLEDIEFVWFLCKSRTHCLSEGTSSSDRSNMKVRPTMGRMRWVSIARSIADCILR
jgi:hypothetical protein